MTCIWARYVKRHRKTWTWRQQWSTHTLLLTKPLRLLDAPAAACAVCPTWVRDALHWDCCRHWISAVIWRWKWIWFQCWIMECDGSSLETGVCDCAWSCLQWLSRQCRILCVCFSCGWYPVFISSAVDGILYSFLQLWTVSCIHFFKSNTIRHARACSYSQWMCQSSQCVCRTSQS